MNNVIYFYHIVFGIIETNYFVFRVMAKFCFQSICHCLSYKQGWRQRSFCRLEFLLYCIQKYFFWGGRRFWLPNKRKFCQNCTTAKWSSHS